MAKPIVKYGAVWSTSDPLQIEMACIRKGGRWTHLDRECGAGLCTHYKAMFSILWPSLRWHRWNELLLNQYIEHRIVGIMGPASSGKTNTSALWALANYWLYPNETTVLCSSTTRDALNLRIWGEIKKYFKKAKDKFPYLAGHIIESKQMITTDGKEVEGREFRNGIIGVPCKVGGAFVGLGSYVGIKNERVLLCADEASFMSRAFLDAVSNLDANPVFKLIAMGNPISPDDALGKICEPKCGWDAFQNGEKTNSWNTRMGGVAIQLVGTDSPNYDAPAGHVPFTFLLTREKIERDILYYGKESQQFHTMDLGWMLKGASGRRVITRQIAEVGRAFDEVNWDGSPRTKIFAIDAAYGSVGGDRCVGGEVQFGKDSNGRLCLAFIGPPIIIPVSGQLNTPPEDQIAFFSMQECGRRGIPPENVFYDSTGRGSLGTAFARLWSSAVNPLEFGGRATDRPLRPGRKCSDEYGKFVTELWFAVRLIIEAGQFRGLTQDLCEEGSLREFVILPNGRIDIEPKEKTKERMGCSPDLFDMLVTAVEGARQRGFQIASLDRITPTKPNFLKTIAEESRLFHQSSQLSYAT